VIYASVESHLSDSLQRDSSNSTGGLYAQDRFLEAVLTTGDIHTAHVFSDTPQQPARSVALQRRVDEQRVQWKHLALLPQLVDAHQYICVSHDTAFASVCSVRASIGRVAFPVCCHVHALVGADILGYIALGLLRAESVDVFLVSNNATREALIHVMDAAVDWIVTKHPSAHLNTSRVEYIPLPTDTGLFRPREKKYCRETVGLDTDKLILLTPRRTLRKRKDDPEPLLVILNSISKRYPNILLVMAGEDVGVTSAADLERQARALGVSQCIRVVSDLPPHVKPLLYGASDIFVSTNDSLQPHFELTPLEAMSSGLPVVTTDWMDSADLIEDGHDGIIVPTYWNPIAAVMMPWLSIGAWAAHFLADRTIVDVRRLRGAIETLLASSELRMELGAAARRTVEAHRSTQTIANRAASLWNEQLVALRTVKDDPLHSQSLDYSRTFRHYATSELNMDTMISISAEGRLLLGDDITPPTTQQVPAMLRADAGRLLEMVTITPMTIQSAVNSGSEFTFEALIWLMKSGYLELDTPTAQPLKRTIVRATT
jgi:glycosyltransferase involved in cell wall biosynthesis